MQDNLVFPVFMPATHHECIFQLSTGVSMPANFLDAAKHVGVPHELDMTLCRHLEQSSMDAESVPHDSA